MNEKKYFDCHFEVKVVTDPEEGSNIGKFEGYASTFGNSDRMDDVIIKGAFEKTLQDHRTRSRQIRMLSQHNRHNLIGGFPSEDAREDERGLFVKGNINLDTQNGRESFALMKQGVLEDMSIGFIIRDSEMNDGKQMIKEAELFEISLVTEPANQEAQITAIKSIMPFKDLPLAETSQAWDAETELDNFKYFSLIEHKSSYFDAFLLKQDDEFSLQIASVIDGELKAFPRAIFAAAATVQASRCGLSKREASAASKMLERYYEKMGRESPFARGFSPDEIKGLGRGDLVAFMRSAPLLSKNGAEYIASKIHGGSGEQVADTQADGLRKLEETLSNINKSKD